MKILKGLTNLVCAGALALGLAGCSKKPAKAWSEKDLQKDYFPSIKTIDPQYMIQEDMYPRDLDNDGKVDILYTINLAQFVADGYEKLAKEKGFLVNKETKKMNSEMVNAVTQAIESQKDFQREYLKSQGLYKEDFNAQEYLKAKKEAGLEHLW